MHNSVKLFGLIASSTLIAAAIQPPSASAVIRESIGAERLRYETELGLREKPDNRLPPAALPEADIVKSEVKQLQLVKEGTEPLLQIEGILEEGDNTFSDDGSFYDTYTFEAEAGQAVIITLESTEFDTYLLLRDSQSETIARNDDISGGDRNSQIVIILPTTGTYRVFAGAYDDTQKGAYRLSVARTQSDNPLVRKSEADELLAQGRQLADTAQYPEALELYQQALAIYREIDELALEAVVLNNLGTIDEDQGKYPQALEYYEQSLEILQDLGEDELAATALNNIGGIYVVMGQYAKVLEYYERSLAINQDLGNRSRIATNLNNIGHIYGNLGDFSQALEYYEQSLAILQNIDDLDREATTLNNIGLVYSNLGNYSQALEYYEQALEISKNIGDRSGEAISYTNAGAVYGYLGRYTESLEVLQQALAIQQGIGDRYSEAVSLNNIGNIYVSLGEYSQALEVLQKSLEIRYDISDLNGIAVSLNNIGAIYEELSESELAIVFYKKSVKVYESIRGSLSSLDAELQTYYAESVAAPYRSLADLLLQENRIIEAQRVLDLLKVQELDDYIRGVERTSETETGVEFLRPEETILARYDALQKSAIAVGQELDELKSTPQEQRTDEQVQRIAQLTELLEDINGDFNNFARSPEIRSLIDQLSFEAQEASLSLNQLDRLRDELQQLNAAIFYPLILEDRLELVITVPDSPPLRRTVDVSREELNAAILEFRTALTDPRSDAKVPAQQLYDWLVRPLEPDLAAAGVETIIYSPDGQLRYIPLAALHDGDNWLIQQYRVNNITAESLTDLTESNTTQPKILAAAYADESLVHTPEVNGTTYTFRGLPGAGLEVDLLPTETKYFDAAFSLAAVRPILDEYSILHFATHAAFVPGVPEDSFILFGNGDTPTLRDVEDWSLNGVDLVVLSACETGVGGLGNGEEILGLGYQFQVSGAKAVMSSLWKVSDNGTQALMTEFYAALTQAGMTKAEALQASQIALIAGGQQSDEAGEPTIQRNAPIPTRDGVPLVGNSAYPGYSHPYYWAPFILIGNGL